jgi:5-methyltetrahydrofolate--homocysteine methyltransferase
VGLFPANSLGDDIAVYADGRRTKERVRLHHLRQQMEKPAGRANLCLADFVAPKESGVPDHVGAFTITAGLGSEALVAEFEQGHDDYHAIMVKALADRLAEALAERMHQRVRTELWGYADEETYSNEELIREKYAGIRPAPGYPACPDHSEKPSIFDLLGITDESGMSLTENYALLPAASVCGWYIAHPEAYYFGVGRVGRDQLDDYAARKGMSVAEAERWLGSNLAEDRTAGVAS